MIVKFEDSQFNRIFPFYILVNPDLVIASSGATMEKIFPGTNGRFFPEYYHIKRPELVKTDFQSIQSLSGQMVVIECQNPQRIILRGQFELLADTGNLLFIGSPWFSSMEQVVGNNLTLNDFALHDPLIDLLHVLKTHEITTEDLKHLLNTVNSQKKELKKAALEIQDIALFTMQNPDPLIRIDIEGNILKENPVAEKFTEFTFNETKYNKVDFWQKIAKLFDGSAEREVIEADFEGKTYSLVIKSIPHYGYYNIYGRDITEQKKNEQQIKQLALLASANENGVLFTDPKGTIIYANDGYSKLTGFDNNEVLGHNPIEIGINAFTDKNDINEMQEAFFSGKSFNIEIIHSRKDGSWFWSRCKGQPTLNEKGQVLHYFAMIEDITLEKERENQLNILSSIAAENTNGVVISDKNGRIEWVNKSFENMTGYSLDELKNTKPGKILQGKDTNPDTVDYLRTQIHAGEPFVCEILNYHRSGKPYWLRIQGQALKDKDGNIIKYFAIEENITKEKETQQKLIESESRFRLALEKIGDNVWEYDFLTNKTVFSNPKNKFIGYTTGESNENNINWWESVQEDDLHLLIENDRKYRNGETDFHVLEYRMVLSDGSIRWVLDRGVVIEKDKDGKPLKVIGTHADVTDKKNAEEALRRKEEKYRNIIANINLGLLEVDNDERIQYANQRFCDMCGYELEELLGKKASAMFVRNESIKVLKNKNELRKKNIADAYEVSVSNKKGEHKWWLISGAPNYNDEGELIGSIGIHLDITEHKKLELELIEAKNNAEASARAKETFLANMSHEIRTPMNAIIGMSNQLAKSNLAKEQQFYLHTIQSASDNLLIIINDILDLSKIEAGKLAIEHIGFEPQKIIGEAMQVMMYKAQEKGISFTNSFFDSKLSPVFIGDPYRLNQVLLNLISNAIKFTDKGAVDVICEVIDDKVASQIVKVTVNDTGIGMDESYVNQIFDKFSQEYKSGSRKFGGTGLGMSISKELIELMGGKINVKSKKGIGTSISITLELTKGDNSNLFQKDTIQLTNDFLKGKKIIVADDNDHNRLVASLILQNYGAEIIEAYNGEETLYPANNADLILMDIQMPVLNGYEATKILRERGNNIPVIAVTANAIKGENEKCIEAGMNDYISKPFDEENFLKTIAKWLLPDSNFKIPEIETSVTTTDTTEPLYDLSSLKAFSRGNESFILKMVNLFCEQTPPLIDEMKSAFLANDLQKMGALAHKVKPTFDNFNILLLKQDIRTIENAGKENIALPDLKELLEKIDKTVTQVIHQMELKNGIEEWN
jgi:two-component system, sensor histidine kinase